MGVLQRFERKLEGLVEGGFARVFRSHVQPVEIAAALQREASDKRAVVGAGRVFVPNEYVVELGQADSERLLPYDAPLRKELAAMVEEHAHEQGWSFAGRVAVRFETEDDLATGVFRVRSKVASADDALPKRPVAADSLASRPRLVLRTDTGERVVPLEAQATVIGRGADADVRLSDTGVSRLHAEVRLEGGVATLVDRGSTNGSSVNGRRVSTAVLHDGDVVELGASTLVFRAPDGER
ncbi:MAG TPA: DUF3662 and FHA domain-containing protein [Mycobacteriales bacterium]|nr:DUF3662 and FHA domain-containing protein [Mycobacteriales bacterium]